MVRQNFWQELTERLRWCAHTKSPQKLIQGERGHWTANFTRFKLFQVRLFIRWIMNIIFYLILFKTNLITLCEISALKNNQGGRGHWTDNYCGS